ncbi:MAG: hypothetical protein IKI40_03955 [Treponema sp.]|nr:hypothetical protein [Treponema sp.]
MANRCPSCGGTLHFDIQKQKLICEYCESEFDPASIKEMEGAGESEAYGSESSDENGETIDAKIFTCPNCGAEVFATDLDAVEYCSYCGTFVTLESRLAKLQKPSYILPFTVTKEKCLELYKEKLKKARFLPKDMQVENAQSSLRNTYIPFWVYTEKFNEGAHASFNTKESWTSGNTEYTQEYDIDVMPNGTIDGIFYDASATLDDRISEQIGNFSQESLQPYNSSLMAGSYADVADVKPEVYNEDVFLRGSVALGKQIKSNISNEDSLRSTFHHASSLRAVTTKQNAQDYAKLEPKLAMLPVWFMTFKNKNRLCYAVINGNTGKMFTEIPSDIKKYALASLLLSIPIFCIFEFLFTLMPSTVMLATGIVSLILMICRLSALKKLRKQENREDDKGFQTIYSGDTEQASSAETKSQAQKSKKKFDFIILFSIASILGTAYMIISKMPNDILYYAVSFVSILATFLSVASMVKAHNLSCSRPIPHFFDKKGAAQ